MASRPTDEDREHAFVELLSALDDAVLYARGFAHALCDTSHKRDADALHAATERARVAAQKLAYWEQAPARRLRLH